jgi:uncharacterized protein (TIGR04255 family)
MADEDKLNEYLAPPHTESVRYRTNFIRTAVCELRFPTILELETKPPHALQHKIKKSYPLYEKQIVEQVGAPEALRQQQSYLFRSKDQHWTITVKASSIAFETDAYKDFEDFYSRLCELLHNAADFIDSDFFTRVGLRYINFVPIKDGTLDGWIRSDLIQPLLSGVLGNTSKYAAFIQGSLKRGHYSLRHGLQDEPTSKEGEYYLDFDYFNENIDFKDAFELIKEFKETNFDLFLWCLGDKAKDLLGEGKQK